jgi:NAD(P)-dependent dehydrogenase (short-subunit alcohol dehydrogenase family)
VLSPHTSSLRTGSWLFSTSTIKPAEILVLGPFPIPSVNPVNKSLATTLGPNAAFFYADISSYDSQAKAFLAVYQKWSRIDALLANAGIVDRSSLYILRHKEAKVEDIPPAPDTSCTDIDYKGFIYGTQLATHFMRHNNPKGGKIVGTASAAGVRPHPSYPEYNGAKAAVINFMRGVADVLNSKEDIKINVVCPGIVATSIIPPEMIAAVDSAFMTPIQTVVGAYDAFLDEEDERFGVAVEATVDKVVELKEWPLGNGKASLRSVTVWEPLFNMLHGEISGISGAIQ